MWKASSTSMIFNNVHLIRLKAKDDRFTKRVSLHTIKPGVAALLGQINKFNDRRYTWKLGDVICILGDFNGLKIFYRVTSSKKMKLSFFSEVDCSSFSSATTTILQSTSISSRLKHCCRTSIKFSGNFCEMD